MSPAHLDAVLACISRLSATNASPRPLGDITNTAAQYRALLSQASADPFIMGSRLVRPRLMRENSQLYPFTPPPRHIADGGFASPYALSSPGLIWSPEEAYVSPTPIINLPERTLNEVDITTGNDELANVITPFLVTPIVHDWEPAPPRTWTPSLIPRYRRSGCSSINSSQFSFASSGPAVNQQVSCLNYTPSVLASPTSSRIPRLRAASIRMKLDDSSSFGRSIESAPLQSSVPSSASGIKQGRVQRKILDFNKYAFEPYFAAPPSSVPGLRTRLLRKNAIRGLTRKTKAEKKKSPFCRVPRNVGLGINLGVDDSPSEASSGASMFGLRGNKNKTTGDSEFFRSASSLRSGSSCTSVRSEADSKASLVALFNKTHPSRIPRPVLDGKKQIAQDKPAEVDISKVDLMKEIEDLKRTLSKQIIIIDSLCSKMSEDKRQEDESKVKLAKENEKLLNENKRLAKDNENMKLAMDNQIAMINTLAQKVKDARAEAGEGTKLVADSKAQLVKEKKLLVKENQELKLTSAGQITIVNMLFQQTRDARAEAAHLQNEVAYWKRQADNKHGQLKEAFLMDLDTNSNFGDTQLSL